MSTGRELILLSWVHQRRNYSPAENTTLTISQSRRRLDLVTCLFTFVVDLQLTFISLMVVLIGYNVLMTIGQPFIILVAGVTSCSFHVNPVHSLWCSLPRTFFLSQCIFTNYFRKPEVLFGLSWQLIFSRGKNFPWNSHFRKRRNPAFIPQSSCIMNNACKFI